MVFSYSFFFVIRLLRLPKASAMTEKENKKDTTARRAMLLQISVAGLKCQICSKEIKMYCNNYLFTDN